MITLLRSYDFNVFRTETKHSYPITIALITITQ